MTPEIIIRDLTPEERSELLYIRGQGNGIIGGGTNSANIDDVKIVVVDYGNGYAQRITLNKSASDEDIIQFALSKFTNSTTGLDSDEAYYKFNIVDNKSIWIPQSQEPPTSEERPPLFEGDLPSVTPSSPIPPTTQPVPLPIPPQPPLVVPPIRITSIANPPGGVEPLAPTVTLVRGNPDPIGTFRASSVDEMFTVGTSLPAADVLYEVGLPFDPKKSFVQAVLVIRNNTVNTSLSVNIKLPEYLMTDSSTTFVIGPDLKVGTTIKADLAAVQRLAVSLTDLFRTDTISITVSPQEVSGPVFVRRELPPLTV